MDNCLVLSKLVIIDLTKISKTTCKCILGLDLDFFKWSLLKTGLSCWTGLSNIKTKKMLLLVVHRACATLIWMGCSYTVFPVLQMQALILHKCFWWDKEEFNEFQVIHHNVLSEMHINSCKKAANIYTTILSCCHVIFLANVCTWTTVSDWRPLN